LPSQSGVEPRGSGADPVQGLACGSSAGRGPAAPARGNAKEGDMDSPRHGFFHLAVLSIAALTASACAVGEITIPEPLQMQYSPSPPSVTEMSVENGKGEVLYKGPRPESGSIEARPTPEQLDGTLRIRRTLSDGNVLDQTLTYEAGKPVKVGYDSVNNKYYVDTTSPPGRPRLYGQLTPFYEFRNRPDTALIRQEDGGGNILGLIKADNDSSDPGFKGSVGAVFDQSLFGWSRKWGMEFTGSYWNSKSTTNVDEIPASGGRLAFFGPLAGGGASIPTDIANLRYSSNYWSWSIEPRLRSSFTLGTLYDRPVHLNAYLGFQYGEDEDDEDMDFESPTFPLRVSSLVKLDNRYYGPTFGFYTGWWIHDRIRLTAGAFGKIYVNELDASRRISVVDGASLSGEDSLSRTTVTAGGGLDLGLQYKFAAGLVGRVGYGYEYADNTPVLKVDQQTGEASVDTGSADVHRVHIGLRAAF
jgi:hypothetical protein